MEIQALPLINPEHRIQAFLDFISLHYSKDVVLTIAANLSAEQHNRVKMLLELWDEKSKKGFKKLYQNNVMFGPIYDMVLKILT